MRERTAIKMKATSASDEEADIYTKLNKAEAIKDLANNPNSTGTTIMGMNMGNVFGGEMKDTLKDVTLNTNSVANSNNWIVGLSFAFSKISISSWVNVKKDN